MSCINLHDKTQRESQSIASKIALNHATIDNIHKNAGYPFIATT